MTSFRTLLDDDNDDDLSSDGAALDVLTIGMALGLVLATLLMLVQGVMHPPPPPDRIILVLPPALPPTGQVGSFAVRVRHEDKWVYPNSATIPRGISFSSESLHQSAPVTVSLGSAALDAELEVLVLSSDPVEGEAQFEIVPLSGDPPEELPGTGWLTRRLQWGGPQESAEMLALDHAGRREFRRRERQLDAPMQEEYDLAEYMLALDNVEQDTGIAIWVHNDAISALKLIYEHSVVVRNQYFPVASAGVLLPLLNHNAGAAPQQWPRDKLPVLREFLMRAIESRLDIAIAAERQGKATSAVFCGVANDHTATVVVVKMSDDDTMDKVEALWNSVWLAPDLIEELRGHNVIDVTGGRAAALAHLASDEHVVKAIGPNGALIERNGGQLLVARWPSPEEGVSWRFLSAPPDFHFTGRLRDRVEELETPLGLSSDEARLLLLACLSPEFLRLELGIVQHPAMLLKEAP